MAVPTWITGQVLTSSDVNTWFVPLVAYKTSDTSRSSTTTVSNDPDLTVPVAANAFYKFEAYFLFEGSSTTGQALKFSWQLPASSTMRYHGLLVDSGGNQAVGVSYTGASVNTAGTTGAGSLRGLTQNGTLFTSSSSGNATVTWSQNVSESSVVTLHAQSIIIFRRVG
jgi:hypothetical protein